MKFIEIFNYFIGLIFVILAAVSYYLIKNEMIDVNIFTLLITLSIAFAIFFFQIGRGLRVESTLDKLSKVPDLENMVKQAKTQEDKIKVLEDEKENLSEYIKIESRRLFLLKRIDDLDKKLREQSKVLSPILDEINLLEKELTQINDSYSTSVSLREIENIRERINRKKSYEIITGIPLLDEIIAYYVRILKLLLK
ncbi:MAG: hypothetical protein KAQ92_01065 [Candidatus Aenigmarchaeota archaeon]|nr:hypothetical protein [Candidatus Aenigmarchaeota archaeon]